MELSRRNLFTGAAGVAAALTVNRANAGVFQDAPTLKIGLVGMGGRGSGAIRNNLANEKGAVLWAVGDLFQDRVDGGIPSLQSDLKEKYKVDDRKFTGFDAYKKVIDSGVDLVILATPPGFRPTHFKAAVEAGKHVFMEKPVAVDGPGIRTVMDAAAAAKAKNLTVVAGTQRRHDIAYNEAMQRIHDGAIGEILTMHAYWNQGGLWSVQQTDQMSDMEWQIRNWLYFTWLSGDHITEQHVHNIDVCNWAMQGHPVKALSLAGRQVRTDPLYGSIFDHFATEYTYENGTRMMSMCRQIDGCASNVSEYLVGSKGTSDANRTIRGANAWRFQGDAPNPYELEHVRLYKSIRANEGFNEGKQVAESTLTAIMGRMSAYSGQEVTWEQALNSTDTLAPAHIEFGPLAVAPVAVPGKTPVK